MTIEHYAAKIEALAKSGGPDVLMAMDTYLTIFELENNHLYENSIEMWNALLSEVRLKTLDLPPGLINQMLETIATHIPLGH